MPFPVEAVDKYINSAGYAGVKVLLYIYRHSGESLDTEEMCGALEIKKEELASAIKFWQKAGFFTVCKRENKAAEKESGTRAQVSASKVIDSPIQYGQKEIAEKSSRNAEIKFLLEAVPSQLGRLISPSECSILVYLYEGAGLPADVIIMLVGYCVESGKGNMRYIEKMAISWAEEGIDTHEKAESKIKQLEQHHGFEGKARSIMGITDRALTSAEQQYLSKWSGWEMPVEFVGLAYDICVARTGKLSFSYINSILKSWHEKGYKTVEQAKNENKKGKGKQRKSPSYDIDEYVRLSMKKLHDE